jgi:hypothetical protein
MPLGQVLHVIVTPASADPYVVHSPEQPSIQLQSMASSSQVLGTHSDIKAPPARIKQTSPTAQVSEPAVHSTDSPQAPVDTLQLPSVHVAMVRPGPAQSS